MNREEKRESVRGTREEEEEGGEWVIEMTKIEPTACGRECMYVCMVRNGTRKEKGKKVQNKKKKFTDT